MSIYNYRTLLLLLNHYVATGRGEDPDFSRHVDGAFELADHIHQRGQVSGWWTARELQPNPPEAARLHLV